MGYLPQKRNRLLLLFFGALLLFGMGVLAKPSTVQANIVLYDPDIDISMGMLYYISAGDDDMPKILPGPYIGGYFSLKSPVFTNYFDIECIYNIVEVGICVNEMGDERDLLLTIPLHIDFAYKIRISEKFSFSPFLGTGFSITYFRGESEDGSFNLHPVIKIGLELKYKILQHSSLKMKLDYGLIIDDRAEREYIRFLKLKFPVPFIP